MENTRLAATLVEELDLDRPPVGLAFVEQPPAGVAHADEAPPSACTFWRTSQSAVVFASAEAHYECPVGAMTMGFELPAERKPEAEQLVGTMVELGYFGMDEIPHLPSVAAPHSGIVYGPLAELPIEPDAVIVQANALQAMLLAEASEGVVLRAQPALAAMGRPACAAVARAVRDGTTTLSLGCIGARTYVELPADRTLVILPAEALDKTAARLPTLAAANRALARFHADKKARFERPGS